MSSELQQAVKERIELGHSQEQIASELREAGYDDETITSVYNDCMNSAAPTVAAELPSAMSLFKQSWAFALSRPDLLVLMALPTLLINVGAIAMGFGWVPLAGVTVVGAMVGFLVVLAVQFLLQLTLAHTAITAHQGGAATLSDSWKWATSNVWPWLWIATLSFCVVFGGFLLFIIPGVIISFYIAFAMYAYIDEGSRGMSALQRSRALVTGNFWDILSRFVVFILIVFGISILFGIAVALLGAVLGVLGGGIEELVVSVFDAVLTAFISLIGVYFAAGLYNALKQRSVKTVTPSAAYPILGWLGAVALLVFVGLGGFGFSAMMSEIGPEGFDWEQMMDPDSQAQMIEAQAELSAEQQAEFDAFMEEFGAELDSF